MDDAPTTARDKGNFERHVLRAGCVRPRYRCRGTSAACAVSGRHIHLVEPILSAVMKRIWSRRDRTEVFSAIAASQDSRAPVREAVICIKANSDVQNLGESLRSGALRVCDPSLMQRRDMRRINASCCVAQLLDYVLVLGSSHGICGWDEGEKTDESALFFKWNMSSLPRWFCAGPVVRCGSDPPRASSF